MKYRITLVLDTTIPLPAMFGERLSRISNELSSLGVTEVEEQIDPPAFGDLIARHVDTDTDG